MFTPHTGRWLSRDPSAYSLGSDRYVYVKNNPTNLVDPTGNVAVDFSPFKSKTLVRRVEKRDRSKLDCKHPPEMDCCTNDFGCRFEVVTTGVFGAGEKGSQLSSLTLSFIAHPGTVVGNRKPSDCFGDFGRAPNGSVTIDTDDVACRFTKDMFREGGEPIPGRIPRECQDLAPSVTAMFVGDLWSGGARQVGLKFTFKTPIRSAEFVFEIETFCGCGEPDQLGRPKAFNSGKMLIVHSIKPR